MKKQLMMALAMLSVSITIAVTSVNAQSQGHSMRITIPFEFVVRGETLPAGAYTIKRFSADKPDVLLLSNTDNGSGVCLLTSNVRSASGPSESKLIFNRYGDRYFLSQVWEAGDKEGRRLFPSRIERVTARELAKETMKRPVTLIAQTGAVK